MKIPLELDGLVDIYDQPFMIPDQQFRVVIINQAFEEAFGISRSEAVGKSCYSLIQGTDRPCPCGPNGENCPFTEVFGQATSKTTMHTYRDGEGREHQVQIQAYPLRADTGEVYIGELIQRDAVRQHPASPPDTGPESRLVGGSLVFRRTLKQLELAATSPAPVLLQGPTGTGKELAAAYVHHHSARRHGPFMTVDCTGLTEELFESELFGHERGAFTGSIRDKQGLFELADGGSLFLDEIGEMSLPLQAKLLRVLESGEFRRVGGVTTRRADVRIISATNRELRDVQWFRNDLYYRVACISVRLPGLAERISDLPQLVQELLVRIGHSSGKGFSISPDALTLLHGYDYPGNIRELRNILWIAAVNSPDGHISKDLAALALPASPAAVHLTHATGVATATEPATPAPGVRSTSHRRGPPPTPFDTADAVTSLAQMEAQHFQSLLNRHRGNRKAVAETLGVSERTVYRKLKRFGLS